MSAPDAVAAADRVVRARGVGRVFGSGDTAVQALQDVDLDVPTGTLVALHGRSGSGKTTLLNILGGLDDPTAGSVVVCGTDVASAGERDRVSLRRDRLAFVFQAFGLLPMLTAAENVEVPLRLLRTPVDERRERVHRLLALVGLDHRAAHRPDELSGGEQQRVAIARALANDPDLLIADEPTGQLDSGTGRLIMDLLRSLVDERGLSMVVATHDPSLLDDADVVHELRDGRLYDGGTVAPRFDGDVDRSRLLSDSVTMPRARRDEHEAFRAADEDDDARARPPAPVGPAARPAFDGEEPDQLDEVATRRRPPRFGPDGELIDE